MEKFPEEIISAIFQLLDFTTIKACHCVCQKWCRVATEFLFSRVVRHRGNSEHFNAILARDILSRFIQVISIGRTDDTGRDLLGWIHSDRVLAQLTARPTTAAVHQVCRRQFTTTLTGMDSQGSPILPALQEIRFMANEAPYMPLHLFNRLRSLHVDTEDIQLPDTVTWESLASLYLRGTVDLHKYIDNLVAFMQGHPRIKKLHLAIVSVLRPLGASHDMVSEMIEPILASELRTELAERIMTRAHMNTNGHERSLLHNIYAELDKSTDETKAEKIRKEVIAAFKTLLADELNIYTLDLETIRIPLENPSQFKLSASIEYPSEDDLAIKGAALPGDCTSKLRLWRNSEHKGRLKIFRRYERDGSISEIRLPRFHSDRD